MNYVFGKRTFLSYTVGASCLHSSIIPVCVIPMRVLQAAPVIC